MTEPRGNKEQDHDYDYDYDYDYDNSEKRPLTDNHSDSGLIRAIDSSRPPSSLAISEQIVPNSNPTTNPKSP